MRFIVSILIVFFAFGLVDLRVLHAQKAAVSSCCCHESTACECKAGTGQHACGADQNYSGIAFRDWGCGIGHENPASPVYSKDFYHFELLAGTFKLPSQTFLFVSESALKPAFYASIENPPELI